MPESEAVLEFTQGDWQKVNGRGNIFVTRMPCDFDSDIYKTDVQIMGHIYRVRGVETIKHWMKQSCKYHLGQAVGLLVQGDVKL